jgi:AcrR family transcriptional regulator
MKEKVGLGIKRKKDFDQSRKDFHRAAFELLSQKGYHLTRVNDIVTLAGRSKGGFYHHFKSKAQLYSELFEQLLDEASNKINNGLQEKKTSRQVLLDLISESKSTMSNLKFLQASVDFFLVALRNEEARGLLRSLHRRSVEMFTRFFQRAIECGEIHADVNPSQVADVLFGSSRGIFIISTILNDGKDLPSQLTNFVELIFLGLERRGLKQG